MTFKLKYFHNHLLSYIRLVYGSEEPEKPTVLSVKWCVFSDPITNGTQVHDNTVLGELGNMR